MANKAIVVAGGGNYSGNNIWGATKNVCNVAYQALQISGFAKSNIRYLNPEFVDVDGDGISEGFAIGTLTATHLQQAIQWAYGSHDVVIVLADHGGTDKFQIGYNNFVYATDLDNWLDALEATITGKIIITYDACYSGSFVDNLVPIPGKNRIVMTASTDIGVSWYVGEGFCGSFTFCFWLSIAAGRSIGWSFFNAKATALQMKQTAQINDNNNTLSNESTDGSYANSQYIIGTDGRPQCTAPLSTSKVLIIAGTPGTTGLTSAEGIKYMSDCLYVSLIRYGISASNIRVLAPTSDFQGYYTLPNPATIATNMGIMAQNTSKLLIYVIAGSNAAGYFNIPNNVMTPADMNNSVTMIKNAYPTLKVLSIYDFPYAGSFLNTTYAPTDGTRIYGASCSAIQTGHYVGASSFSAGFAGKILNRGSIYDCFVTGSQIVSVLNKVYSASEANGNAILSEKADKVMFSNVGYL